MLLGRGRKHAESSASCRAERSTAWHPLHCIRLAGVFGPGHTSSSCRYLGSITLIAIGESAVDLIAGQRFTLHFNIGIDEEIERRAGLTGRQLEIATGAESDAILGQIAEVVVGHLGILVGLGDINADPA